MDCLYTEAGIVGGAALKEYIYNPANEVVGMVIFSDVCVCQSVCSLGGGGIHVTTTHDALYHTIQGPVYRDPLAQLHPWDMFKLVHHEACTVGKPAVASYWNAFLLVEH